ncbi:MAG TPA: hypothetical protein PKW61_00845, partial [Tenuifilaceae bacterium]|nr:hypothetical protein [Tenuifilaceae bacterium]
MKRILIFIFVIASPLLLIGQQLYLDATILKDLNILKISTIDNKIWLLSKENDAVKLYEVDETYDSINIVNANGFILSPSIKFIAAGKDNSCYISDGEKIYKYSNGSIAKVVLYNNQNKMDIRSIIGKGDQIYFNDDKNLYIIDNNTVKKVTDFTDQLGAVGADHEILRINSGNAYYSAAIKYDGKLYFYTFNSYQRYATSINLSVNTVNDLVFSTFYPDKYVCFSSGDSLYYVSLLSWPYIANKLKTKVNHIIGGFEYKIATAGDSCLTIYGWNFQNEYSFNLGAHINGIEAKDGNVLWVSTTKGLFRFVDKANIFFQNNRVAYCLNTNVPLRVLNNMKSYQWQKDVVDIENANSFEYVVSDTGNYRVITQAYYQWNHKDTSNVISYYENKNVEGVIITTDNKEFCEGENAHISVLGNNLKSYKWYNNDLELKDETADYIDVYTSGSYKCLMENCNGYSNYSNSINIVVHELPNPNIYTLNNNPFCGKDSLFVECSTHLSRYFWYFKENGEGSWQYIKGGRSEKPRISIFKEGELKLFLQDDYGCSSESSTIYCKPLPNPFVMIVQDANALVAQPYLEFGGNRLYESNLQNYQWFINNQILPAEVGETIIPLLNGNYSVRVTDENGCVNISENY